MGAIEVGGGGSAIVATDELFSAAAALREVRSAVDDCLAQLPWANWDRAMACSWMRIEPEEYLIRARTALAQAGECADRLVAGLFAAAENYGNAERALGELAESMGAKVGWVVGRLWPLALIAGAGVLVSGALAVIGGSVVTAVATGDPRGVLATAWEWVRGQQAVLSHPLFVEAVRTAVSSVDNAMLGAVGLPQLVASAIDDRALRWFGLEGAAAALIVVSGPRLLAEGPVSSTLSERSTAAPPRGFGDLAKRIPGGVGEPQIRIEKYPSGGETSWIVYVGGTLAGAVGESTEPWDNTSNVHAIAGAVPGLADTGAASVRATLAAMREAGVGDGDPIVAVGYSQGGIVAARVMQERTSSATGLITFGAPTGQLAVPSGISHVAVEHREDLIPALGGHALSQGRGGLDRVVVRRSVLEGVAPTVADPLPAHAIREYRETAALMDNSADPRVQDARARLKRVSQGQAEVTFWHAERSVTRADYE